MGMKAPVSMPPQIDSSVTDRTADKETKLEAEKQRMLKAGSSGRSSTILTSGSGITEEAKTGRTLLGGTY
jgi:hypothetical protein|tara:strand:- start:5411 stop:5620 length:210 start_codon:yes stop_codon:yes gene_type:complete